MTPPTTSAGKSLAWVMPRSSSATISDAVATPGQERDAARPAGRRAASASRPGRRGSARRRRAPPRPGGRRDRAGADDGAVDLGGDALDRGAAPPSVRSVTSIAGRPPRTSASASGTASSTSSITTTGTTGARETSSSTVMRTRVSRTGSNTEAPASGRPTRSRKAANSSRPVPWVAAARNAGSRSPRSTSTSSRPLSASTRTTSPSRRRDSGPPAAASGRAVDRRRDLARGAAHATVGDERDAVAAVHQHAERGRELVQLGHPVRARALVAHDRDVVVVELAAVEGGEEVAPGRRRRARGRSRRGARGRPRETFITARPSAPSSTRMPPSGANGVAHRAQDGASRDSHAGGPPAQLARLVEVRLVAVAAEAEPGDGLDVRVHEAGVEQLADHERRRRPRRGSG